MSAPNLAKPLALANGELQLNHRVVLAPLTRMRATPDTLIPQEMAVEYYSQRASRKGLLISEATSISPEGTGYTGCPGIWTKAQVDGWKKVTKAVHDKGAYIVCQLWHVGRIAHTAHRELPLIGESGRDLPSVSASAVMCPGKTVTPKGVLPNALPRPLEISEMKRVCEDYRQAAINAKEAGFDGVELHAAHGYLLDQFLNNGVNKRTDKYGGSIENRCRLMFEVLDALQTVWGSRVAIRLSPHRKGTINYHFAKDSDPDALYTYAVKSLNKYKLLYLLLTEPRWTGVKDGDPLNDKGHHIPAVNGEMFRPLYEGRLIGGGGFTPKTAEEAVRDGLYDCIAFGRWFIANPDLPQRLSRGSLLNIYNRKTFYAQTAEGYTDYPSEDGKVGTQGKYKLLEQHRIGTSLKQVSKL